MEPRTTMPHPARPLDEGQTEIRFGPFRLDLRAGQLYRGAQPLPLRPKTWAVLLHLTQRPGALVTRDELLDSIWPDVAVTPDTVTKSIGELRQVLGDDSRTPRYVETVHRRGFRFIAEPTGPRPAAERPEGAGRDERREAPPVCFVGRECEVRTLCDRFAAALSGERQLVFITGSAGAGKTALVDAFLASRAVGELGMPVWIGRAACVEQHGPQEPYMPVLDALQRLVRPPNVERMIGLMRRAAPLWLAQMPWLLGDDDAAALRHSLRGTRPERMPRELANLVETLTTDVTLILVLEDLHWSDPATVDLLNLLAQRRDPARLLVIGTFRPADVAVRDHPLGHVARALRRQDRHAELAVNDLTLADVQQYLDGRFPGHAFPPALADAIQAHTGGHPLFVVALTDQLRSQGVILDTAPGWALSRAVDTIDFGVPDDVCRLLQGQFRALSPADRSLLEAASAAGEHIISSILTAALGWPVDDAEHACETLANAQRFLRVAGTHEWPDGTRGRRYAFTHELYRQVVYDETPVERRARLHATIGRALERAQGERVYDLAPQLAAHFSRAHDDPRRLHYLTVAGVRARERFAGREALQYLEAALALVEGLEDPDEHQKREIEVRLARGRVLGDVHGFAAEAVRDNYERLSALCDADRNRVQVFEALYVRWQLHALRGEREPTLALAHELAALAAELDSLGYRLLTDSMLVRTAYYDRRYADAVRHQAAMQQTLADHPSARTPIDYGIDPVLAATTHCAGAVWFLGDDLRARSLAAGAVASARQSGNPFYLAGMLTQAAMVDAMIGWHDAAAALAEEAEALAANQGFALWRAMAAAIAIEARARQRNDAAAGRGALAAAIEAFTATGMVLQLDILQAFLAECHLRAGARGDGLAAVERGLAFGSDSLVRSYEPELWRLRGELLLLPGASPPSRGRRPAKADAAEWSEAERCFRHAIHLARDAEARSLELRAALSLARALKPRGRSGEARDLLAGIAPSFAAPSEAPDAVAARALQRTLTTRA